MRVRKAVIPCAGVGTRLLPVTKVVPKELLPIGTRPAIQYVVEEIAAAGITEIILVANPQKAAIADYFRPDPALNALLQSKGKHAELEALHQLESLVDIRVVHQHEPLGLGHAILCAQEAVGDEPFLVALPDRLVVHPISATHLLCTMCEQHAGWGLLLEEVPTEMVGAYGIVACTHVDKDCCRITGAVEKPLPANAPSRLSILGRYVLPPTIFAKLAGGNPGALGELQLTDAIDAVARDIPGYGMICPGKIYDVGTVEGLAKACAEIPGTLN